MGQRHFQILLEQVGPREAAVAIEADRMLEVNTASPLGCPFESIFVAAKVVRHMQCLEYRFMKQLLEIGSLRCSKG